MKAQKHSVFPSLLLVSSLLATSLLVLIPISFEVSAYTPHDPIYINGNADFTSANGVTGGSGTPTDPYIIEGWQIDATTAYGIRIDDTNAHFVIRNVYVHSGGSSYDGFYGEFVVNGRVENAVLSGNRYGIYLFASTNVVIFSNNMSTNEEGITLNHADDIIVFSNEISSNTRYGLHLRSCTDITAFNNTFNLNGIFLDGLLLEHFNTHDFSTNNTINAKPLYYYRDATGVSINDIQVGEVILANCTDVRVSNLQIAQTDVGIEIAFVDGGVVEANSLSSNRLGIAIKYSADITVKNNTVSSNRGGIDSRDSKYVTISSNRMSHNSFDSIFAWHSDNVTISHNDISESNHGVNAGFSANFTVFSNHMTNNRLGAEFFYSVNVTAYDNIFVRDGIVLSGYYLEHYNSHDLSSSNTINGKPLHYYKDCADVLIDSVPVGELIITNCTNVRATNLHINQTVVAVQMAFVDGVRLERVDLVQNDGNGIEIVYSTNVTFSGGNISSSWVGFWSYYSNEVTISSNSIWNNQFGIVLGWDTYDFLIMSNTIYCSKGYGFYFRSPSSAVVYHNNIVDNTKQAYDEGSGSSQWDNGYPSGGNYWSDYVGIDKCSGPNQDVCPDPDGLGDTPYVIDADSQDGYPLMAPTVSPPARAPTILSANLSGRDFENVTITWSLSPDDGAGFKSVVGYEIYGNASYDSDGLGYGLVASLPKGTSEFVDTLAGEGDPDDYFYQVCAIDLNSNTTCAENQAAKFTRPLTEGVNLVSIPLIQSSNLIESVFQTVEYDKAWYYDSSSQEWKWQMKLKPYSGELARVDLSVGLWINVTKDSNLTIAGVVPSQTVVHLHKGWNLVGFPSFQQDYTVGNLKVAVTAERIEGFEASAQPYFLRLMLDEDSLQTGSGYWVRVEADVDWIVEVS